MHPFTVFTVLSLALVVSGNGKAGRLFMESPDPANCTEGRDLTASFQCSISTDFQTGPVVWFMNGSLIPVNKNNGQQISGTGIGENSTLAVQCTREYNNSDYQCGVQILDIGEFETSTKVTLTVYGEKYWCWLLNEMSFQCVPYGIYQQNVSHYNEMVNISSTLIIKTVRADKKFIVSCHATDEVDHPIDCEFASVPWLESDDTKPLHVQGNFSAETNGTDGHLYKYIIVNNDLELITLHVKFNEGDLFTEIPESSTCSEGKDMIALFQCRISTDPDQPPTGPVVWYRNGNALPVSRNNGHQISGNGVSEASTLTVQCTREYNNSDYHCGVQRLDTEEIVNSSKAQLTVTGEKYWCMLLDKMSFRCFPYDIYQQHEMYFIEKMSVYNTSVNQHVGEDKQFIVSCNANHADCKFTCYPWQRSTNTELLLVEGNFTAETNGSNSHFYRYILSVNDNSQSIRLHVEFKKDKSDIKSYCDSGENRQPAMVMKKSPETKMHHGQNMRHRPPPREVNLIADNPRSATFSHGEVATFQCVPHFGDGRQVVIYSWYINGTRVQPNTPNHDVSVSDNRSTLTVDCLNNAVYRCGVLHMRMNTSSTDDRETMSDNATLTCDSEEQMNKRCPMICRVPPECPPCPTANSSSTTLGISLHLQVLVMMSSIMVLGII